MSTRVINESSCGAATISAESSTAVTMVVQLPPTYIGEQLVASVQLYPSMQVRERRLSSQLRLALSCLCSLAFGRVYYGLHTEPIHHAVRRCAAELDILGDARARLQDDLAAELR